MQLLSAYLPTNGMLSYQYMHTSVANNLLLLLQTYTDATRLAIHLSLCSSLYLSIAVYPSIIGMNSIHA